MATLDDYAYGPQARNALDQAAQRGLDGATAALETFYYALNRADLDVLAAVWADDPLVQLDNPVGGILRSHDTVVDLYRQIFTSGVDLQVTFGDAVTYPTEDTVVFAGYERGSYAADGERRVALEIRTTRVFGWDAGLGRWAQLHHHGSIDDADALADYQRVVRGAAQ